MDRQDLVLAALSPAMGSIYTPVQVQKLFFLLDKEIPALIEGPYFDFQPYHYGPFDKDVYNALERLSYEGLVEIIGGGSWRNYRLTDMGQEKGDKLLNGLPRSAQDYIRRVSKFVRSLDFTSLVQSIYKAYPEMKVNSVFQS